MRRKTYEHIIRKKVKRPKIHAKKGSSKLKSSKLYKKKNRGQGKP